MYKKNEKQKMKKQNLRLLRNVAYDLNKRYLFRQETKSYFFNTQ